jgi:large subunit ribosomal protein L4
MSHAILLSNTVTKLKPQKTCELPKEYDDINSHNLYLFNKSYLASLRANTARVKNRSAVRGGGRKPTPQKGGGSSRKGTIRSPLFVGGGQIFGPTKRNYNQKINKKQVKLALCFALKEQAKRESLFVVDKLALKDKKTKEAKIILDNLKARDCLIVVKEFNEETFLAFRNISTCYVIEERELNAYLMASFYNVVMEQEVFDNITTNTKKQKV